MSSIAFNFDNSYVRLPGRFYAKLPPEKVSHPEMVKVNCRLAEELGLDPDLLKSDLGAEILSGNHMPAGAEPIAMVYAGHQFGGWVPRLGDGRAHLIGEIVDRNGRRRDIQLKGSGVTPYSRQGDGRAWLGPVLREYIVSEAMHALDIPTTRSLAAVTTGEPVYREDTLPGAVLTRVATCHVRVGTFQYFYARNDIEALRILCDHVVRRLYPQARETRNPALTLLQAVSEGQARLVAKWMGVGFIHGVMNTDNMSLACETIDFGPCAFMDRFSHTKVFSSIDHYGRYCYANQPAIALWNLTRFATALIPILASDKDAAVAQATEILDEFAGHYSSAWLDEFGRKLGLAERQVGDDKLAADFLDALAEGDADFTIAFRKLSAHDSTGGESSLLDEFSDHCAINRWLLAWRQRLGKESRLPKDRKAAMLAANPAVIARNHQIEIAISAAVKGDFSQFKTLNSALARPFEEPVGNPELVATPEPHEVVTRTFCGT